MSLLNAGTPEVGIMSSAGRTVEQNAKLRTLDTNPDGTISSSYMGSLLYPDGTLTRDYSKLVKPPLRVAEINAVLAAGSDPAKPSGGFILCLDIDGVPVSYVGIGSPPSQSPAPIISAPLTISTTEPTVKPGDPVKLTDIIKLSVGDVARQYVKGTLKAIESQVITVTNTANNVSVQIAFAPQQGLTFNPSTFLLAPNTTQTSTLTFDIASIDSLQEGFTTYNIPITLSSPTAILPMPMVKQAPPPEPAPPITAPPIVVSPPIAAPPQVDPLPPTPPEPGHWELVQKSPGNTQVDTIISFNAPNNGQAAQAINNYVRGSYDTVYGYHRTTVTGPTYDYKLVGNLYSAGPQPIPPAPSISITEDDNKYQILSNVYLGPVDKQPALPPAPAAPIPAPVFQGGGSDMRSTSKFDTGNTLITADGSSISDLSERFK